MPCLSVYQDTQSRSLLLSLSECARNAKNQCIVRWRRLLTFPIHQKLFLNVYLLLCSCSLPVWFSMLHPLADLSPVICKIGNDLSYITVSSHSLIYVSADKSPYLAVIYDVNSKSHSMYLIRRTTPLVRQRIGRYAMPRKTSYLNVLSWEYFDPFRTMMMKV